MRSHRIPIETCKTSDAMAVARESALRRACLRGGRPAALASEMDDGARRDALPIKGAPSGGHLAGIVFGAGGGPLIPQREAVIAQARFEGHADLYPCLIIL